MYIIKMAKDLRTDGKNNNSINAGINDSEGCMGDRDYYNDSYNLIDFIEKSPSPYHVVDNIRKLLSDSGMTELSEKEKWILEPGHGYYVVRGMSSIIAFTMPENNNSLAQNNSLTSNKSSADNKVLNCYEKCQFCGFNIVASHSDSPSFKIKENPQMPGDNHYVSLNVEKYGGMIMSTWLDRPLSIAGRAVVADGRHVSGYLVNADKDLVVIPNLAIHMDRKINEGYSFNAQKDMIPLFGDENAKDKFDEYVRELVNIACKNSDKDADCETKAYCDKETDIDISTELYLYNRERGTIWGYNDEFISAPRLDDIQCAYSSVTAFIETYEEVHSGKSKKAVGSSLNSEKHVNVCCVFNNEEVGSTTRQGADSTFLSDVLERICIVSGKSREEYMMALAQSFMISADNAHAVHPNHQEKADPTNRPYMNSGIVIKFNGNQKYTTDAVSYAVFKNICKRAGVPYQTYANRSDIAGGSTLGNISNSHVSVNTVDIGLAQLSMHSAYETAGVKDTTYMIKALKEFYISYYD